MLHCNNQAMLRLATDNMAMDILTKALPKWKVSFHILSLRLHHTCGGVMGDLPSAHGKCSVADAVDSMLPTLGKCPHKSSRSAGRGGIHVHHTVSHRSASCGPI